MKLTSTNHITIDAMVGSPALTALVVMQANGQFLSENVTQLSHILPGEFPGSPTRGNACWGSLSPSGREYALMGMGNGMAVVEVTDGGVPVVVDMGAYEYQFDPVEDVIFADLNGDGSVGAADLLGLLISWGPCAKGCCLADLDLDCSVGAADLLILLANWG
ncbi:MAG: hypothetical protein V3T53_08630 [Phycisphaerales bacterium]